jgi:methanogenic corrinoid protein MtbC1
LLDGDEEQSRKAIGAWYAKHGSIASVADRLIAPAFRSIGEQWRCGEVEIYQERRGCELCNRLMQELRRLLPEPAAFSPFAMGGTCSGDDYQLPTQLIEMVFRENGWRTIHLGSNVPLSSMLSAARKHMPRIFWLSVSHIADQDTFLTEYDRFATNLPKGISLVVGGRALTDEIRPQMTYAAYCDTLQQLATLASSLRIGAQPNGPQIQNSGAKTAVH